MARDRYISVRVEQKLHEKLASLAKASGLSLQKFLEKAFKRLIKKD